MIKVVCFLIFKGTTSTLSIMKNIFLLLLSLFGFYSSVLACSFSPDPFCSNARDFPDQLIVAGVISGVDIDGIDLDVIRIIRGEESKTTIRIWDGTDFDCNGLHSMAADNIGVVNDTVILMLPKIDSIRNVWDVIGDYCTPDFYVHSKVLRVKNNIVRGFIQGVAGAPDEYIIWEFDYAAFVGSFLEEMDCSNITDVNELSESNSVLVFPNPATDNLWIDIAKATTFSIHDIIGNSVSIGNLKSGRNNISIEELRRGLYFLYLGEGNRTLRIVKE